MAHREDKTAPEIIQLLPQNIVALWPQIAPIIRPAVVLVSTHTVSDIYRAVVSMRAQVWASVHETKVLAAVISEFVDYPAGLFVRIWIAASLPEVPFDTAAFMEKLDEWRCASNAIGFEAVGRMGWLKRYPGLKCEGLIMRWVP